VVGSTWLLEKRKQGARHKEKGSCVHELDSRRVTVGGSTVPLASIYCQIYFLCFFFFLLFASLCIDILQLLMCGTQCS
jgi:hypothetical protein